MFKKNTIPSNEEKRSRPSGRYTRSGAVLLIALSVFYVVVCTPVYLISVTNVLISETIFPQIWDLFQNLLLFLNFWIVAAWLAVICIKEHFAKVWQLCAWFVLSSVIRYFGSVSISTRIMQSNDLAEDYIGALEDSLSEWVPLVLLIGIVGGVWLFLMKNKNRNLQNDLPPEKIFPLDSPVKKILFWLAAVPSLLHILARIRYDISKGAPKQTVDLIGMILFYLADLLCWLIGYLVIFFFVNRLTRPKKEEVKSP